VTYAPSKRQQERITFRRRQTIRSVLLAALSTAVVGMLLGFGVTGSPGWPRVKQSFLNWDVAVKYLPDILDGFWLNIQLFLVCAPLALLLGLLMAVLRTLRGPVFFPVRALATGYTYTFRGLPLIITIYLFAFGLPGLRLQGTPDVLVLGGAAITITYGSYLAEVFRAGIESVHPSQVASATALGLSHSQAMRHVVVPQAVRRVLPPLLNDFISLQKDTALVVILGLFDALGTASDTANYDFNYTPYVVVAVLFVALTVPLARVTDWLANRARDRERAGFR
jgi:polar amino acid transport system permease protein